MGNQQIDYARRVQQEYAERQLTKADELRALDRKVKLPAEVLTYTLGICGSLVLGVGLCLAMKVIGDLVPLGIVVGVAGLAIVSANYFIYRAFLKARKRRYADRVLALSNQILKKD